MVMLSTEEREGKSESLSTYMLAVGMSEEEAEKLLPLTLALVLPV